MATIKAAPRPPRLAVSGLDKARSLLGTKSPHDAIVIITPLPTPRGILGKKPLSRVKKALDDLRKADASLESGSASTALAPAPGLPGKRLVVGCTGRLDRFTDDVRLYAEAGEAAMTKAWKAGAKDPLFIVLSPSEARYAHAADVALMGALSSLWRSVEARLSQPRKGPKVRSIGVLDSKPRSSLPTLVRALEQGRAVARDIGGTQAEIMTPEAVASYVEDVFEKGPVSVTIDRDLASMEKGYPLLWNVSRGCNHVERYLPRVIRMEYSPENPKRTVFLVGKGVTYDTGGHNIKIGAGMAGMSRDKCGAGSVAGVMRVVQLLKPPDTRVVAYLGMVRNAVDAEAYVTDEVFTSRAGVRVRIGNTDAEGRLVLADCLAAAREEAEKAHNPTLLTVATLTGHAVRTVGPYPIAIENGPALDASVGAILGRAGSAWAEPFEISRLRREDFEAVASKTDGEDVLSMNANINASTPRGHQLPMAFFQIAAGMEKDGKCALPYVHVDIAGSSVKGADWAYGKPLASSVVPLYQALIA
ncbi:MAG: leucyl aminopeptidase family protein [Deltaproteobacteria bacterium]|nr:leucyl aminopeptidase family protein [Deltaproteobacteria bacterium]